MAKEVLFTKTHEWVKQISETEAYVGLSFYAARELGDIVYLDIEKKAVVKGKAMGEIEAVKAVSELYSPFTGKISEINEAILDNPSLINENSEETWICKIINITDSEELLTKTEYDKLIKE